MPMFDLNSPPSIQPPPYEPRRTLADRINQFFCFHDWLFHFDDDCISMECQTCGKTTPGWTLHIDKRFRKPQ